MFFQPKSYIGVDIGAGGIKLVELRREKNRPVLFTYALADEKHDIHKNKKFSEDEIGDYAAKIKKLCQVSKVTAKTAVVSLPISSVFHAIVTLPITKRKDELKQMLKAEIAKFISVPLEEMALDYQPLEYGLEKNTQRILVNAVPMSLINFYTGIFQGAGLTLEALEPESTALARSLVGHDTAVTMLVDIGAERTNFFIIDQAMPVTHQSTESGGNKIDRILQNILGIGEDAVEQAKKDLFCHLSVSFGKTAMDAQKFLSIFMPIIDPIVKEIEISFELFLRQIGNENKRPEKVILTGGMAFLPYLAQYISDKFKLKCYIGDPWARVVYQDSLKPLLSQIGPRMAVAIGLALRNVV